MKKMCVFARSIMKREFGRPDAVIIPGTKSTIRDMTVYERGRIILRGKLVLQRMTVM